MRERIFKVAFSSSPPQPQTTPEMAEILIFASNMSEDSSTFVYIVVRLLIVKMVMKFVLFGNFFLLLFQSEFRINLKCFNGCSVPLPFEVFKVFSALTSSWSRICLCISAANVPYQ